MSNDASADEPAKGVNRDRVECACHCGAVKFDFVASRPPNEQGFNATRCNCTFCTKTAMTVYHVQAPEDDFILKSPKSKDEVAHYAVGEKFIKRYFCSTCGVHCWMEGAFPLNGNMIPLFSVNLSTVDQPQPGVDLSQVKLRYFNMLGKGFDNPDPTLHDAPCKGGLP